MSQQVAGALSRLPQVDALLRREDAAALIETHGRRPLTEALRAGLDDARERVREGQPPPRPAEILASAGAALARRDARRLTRVINATGVVLHTNLGRAPLSAAARQAVVDAAGYTNVEYELTTGQRGSRTAELGTLTAEACGTEAATVVNNGAGALLLVLAALATDREVVVSRGELIEIGGSYRLPDLVGVSGARLVEVGTTNRTRLADYRGAIGDETALLVKVHASNYRVVGFTEQTSPAALVGLGAEVGVPVVHDLGSGLLVDAGGELADEPSVAASVRAGVDLVVFSGDKLLGGPQAGVIAGRADLVWRCTRHPMARALRVDKLQRAALEATLDAHLRADVPLDVPTVAMLHADPDVLATRAGWMAEQLGGEAAPLAVAGLAGGGTLPGVELPSWAVALSTPEAGELAAHLRTGEVPVIARVEDGAVLLDLRTVPPSQDTLLVDLVLDAWQTPGGGP